MLVLARQKDESVVITIAGKRVELTVLRINNTRTVVSLGFYADHDVIIHRKEIQILIDAANEKEGIQNGFGSNNTSSVS